MLDDLSSKSIRAQCGKSVTQPGPSPCDLRTWYQELIVTTVYKCHFIGVAYLVLLSIVVSWGNLIVPWVIYPVVPVTSAGSLNVSVNTITWLSTSTLFTYCIKSNIATSVLLLVGNWIWYRGTVSEVKNYRPFCLSIPSKFSESSFTEKGRTSAIAIASLANLLGAALGQFLNPSLAKILDDIPRIILIISTISLLAIIPSFFHSKPLTAPSIATAVNRTPLFLLSLLFSIYVALFNFTIILINKVVLSYSATEEEVGVIDRILISAGLLGAAILLLCCIIYIALIFVPVNTWCIWPVYLVCVILGLLLFSTFPFILELLAEITIPYFSEIVFIITQSVMVTEPSANLPCNILGVSSFTAILRAIFLQAPLLLTLVDPGALHQRER
ncbi:hypothetical protein BDV27DRAFT_143362 [Aspergillus caelatus]|uniref:Uncharacterized protein n=1 Tax=Aspergillus caelatus TaxID=61420 RepID=A0A5N7AA65_9EURO|nr:uncharacterized protein BDV27DRAFT_143362 [Aspergillus caelatus]KAE8366734.1 hypothetical protein BDV27DRAFT_143362 [Aspergillus caelatus]